MKKDGQGRDIYIQKLKLFVHPKVLKKQIRAFVDCMFTKVKNIEFFDNFPEIFCVLFSKAKAKITEGRSFLCFNF